MTSTASNADCRQPSTSSSTSAVATTSPVMYLIYHKIGEYYGVLWNGMTMFSGSYDACVEYMECCS